MTEIANIGGNRIQVVSIEEGVDYTAAFLKKRLDENRRSLVLAGAFSSAGKNYLLKEIEQQLPVQTCKNLDADDWYYGGPLMSEMCRQIPSMNWDRPEAVDLKAYYRNLCDLKENRPTIKPKYLRSSGARTVDEPVHPYPIILSGGNYCLFEDRIRELADMRLFISASKHSRLIRRLLRDTKEFGVPAHLVLKQIMETVEPMAKIYIEPTMQYADLIIRNDLVPELEYLTRELFHSQIKYATDCDADWLTRRNAKIVSSVFQTDIYLTPDDQDLSATDEIIRIRNEDGRFLFSNKGPKLSDSKNIRPKFEFEIDKAAADSFPAFYGKEIAVVTKKRTTFELGGLTLALDQHVAKRTAKGTSVLGNFVEFQKCSRSRNDLDSLRTAAEKLQFERSKCLVKSYIEL